RAERALAWTAALRALCFTVGGWLPLAVLLAAGPWLIGRGLTAGAIMGGLTYVLIGLQPALSGFISVVGRSGLRYMVTLAAILDATEAPAKRRPRPWGDQIRDADLVARDLTFSYGPHADPVIENLNLSVRRGDHLAVVGPSGVGKSTLAGLLCGLLPPDAGTVRIGGTAVGAMLPRTQNRLRLLIPQEAYVFSGSVAENLAYLRPDARPAEIVHAVRALGAQSLVDRLGGATGQVNPAALSAGQRQLLALIRAYLSLAPIAVLDEATCHLDPAAERRAEHAFAQRSGTLIVIAHRASSALRARKVLVLDGASAVVGDHAWLRENSALYRELLGHWNTASGDGADQIHPDS
ncbi:MAG: ATP-binding cassette domain-containing protein, partial [Stackebrandtia sp.]